MQKAKKILLITVIALFILIVVFVVFMLSLGATQKKELCELELPKVASYLKNKYDEDMVIYDYGFYDGLIAHVKLKENENIKFNVYNWRDSGNYYDEFLERYLSNEIEELVKDKLCTEKIAIKEVFVGSTTAPPLESAEKLYQCYTNVGLESFCEEAFKVISLAYISVYVDKKTYETEKERIYDIVQGMGYPIDTIYVRKDYGTMGTRDDGDVRLETMGTYGYDGDVRLCQNLVKRY